MRASSPEVAACIAGFVFALGACDVLLGLDRYGSCASGCDATVNEASAIAPNDAPDALRGTSAQDAIDEEAAPSSDAPGDEDAGVDSSVPAPPQVWAQWPMPNPDASIAPESSLPLPNPMAYDASIDGDVFDIVTGLHWQADGRQAAPDYASAASVCAALGPGWRVPARIELVSLVDFTSVKGLTIDQATFFDTQGGSYWTSSAVPHDGASPTQWWTVSFSTGLVDDSVPAQWVRCVRGGAP